MAMTAALITGFLVAWALRAEALAASRRPVALSGGVPAGLVLVG
jgi:hypothetical protein